MSFWQRILQGITAFSLDTIVTTVTSVLGAILVFRYLSPAAYGQLALFLSFYAIGMVFLSFGLSGVFTAEIARARGDGERGWAKFLIRHYAIFLLITATLIMLAFVGIGHQQRELQLWSIMGVYLWLSAPNELARVLFHSTTRYRRVAGQSMIRSISRLTWLATLPWWWPREPLVGVALTYPLMELTAILFSLLMARLPWAEFRAAPTAAYSFGNLTSFFQKQGVYATLSMPVKKIADQLPIWFLKVMVGDVGVGAYAAAQRTYSLIFSFFSSLERTLLPLVAEQATTRPERLRVALRQAQKYSFWLGVMVAIGGGVMAHWIILLIAGEEYIVAIPLFALLLWRLPLYAFVQSQRPIFYAIGEQKWLFLTYLVIMAFEALFLLIGIHLFGPVGAVLAILLRTVMAGMMRLSLTARLASHLWIDPRSVIRVEEFDLRLWRDLKKMVQRTSRGR